MLWRVEYRNHLPYFSIAIGLTVAAGIATAAAPHVQVFPVVLAMTGLVAWVATTVYVAAAILRFLTLGHDTLLHVSALSPWRVTARKALVLGTYMVVQHVATLLALAPHIGDTVGAERTQVLAYLFAAKVVSIATFVIAVILVATTAKTMRGRGPATTVFVVALMLVVGAQAILLWRLGAPGTHSFFIGVGGDFTTVNLYANVLPLILTGPAEGYLPPIAGLSVVLNVGAAACMLLGTLALIRWRRFDHVGQ
jgi:hypothetical protein